MANIQLPLASQPAVVAGGLFSTPWYRYLSNLNIAANGYVTLQNEIDALQAQVDAIPAGFSLQSQMSIAQAGAATPGSVITISLVNDEQSPAETSFYGTDDAGNKGWQPMLGAFSKTGSININAASNGVVSFQADLFYLMATR
jgi:hypothetical protein